MKSIIANVDLFTPDIAISHHISALLALCEENPLVRTESQRVSNEESPPM